MKRLGTLVMAILLITGCNAAMKPNMEETELLWAETEKNIQKWAISTKAAASPEGILQIMSEPMDEISPQTPTPTEEPASQPPAPMPTPEQDKNAQESADRHEQTTLPQTEQPAESPVTINWPYPRITCPPEPEWPQITCQPEPPTATPWPYITAPEPPTYTPEPEPMEPPQEEPAPTPVPDVPVDPTPEPTEQPTDPTPESPIEQPSAGYAECSCGAKLTPEEVLPHMKAHALNGESHSYRAY